MKKTYKCLVALALMVAPSTIMAQSSYEDINDSQSDLQVTGTNNLSINTTYQQWLSQYEEVGSKINEVSEQYQTEVNKRGYPKKKTIQKKIELVNQYIQLLEQERDTPQLNQNLDISKVNRKICLWQQQLADLKALLEKI